MTPKYQRGAVTLLGALFLVFVLAVIGVSLLRQAGRDILAVAGFADSTEALFVAETGVEHLAWRYANGSTCAGLALSGPVTTGRGQFSVAAASVLANGDCRIRVTGRVGSTPAVRATRSLEVDLRLGGTEGWIVGDRGTILRWNGTSWTSVASPTTRDLFAVHCTAGNACKAVGAGGTILHWDGASWSLVASGTTADLFAIACEPGRPDNCFAAGGRLLFFFSIGTIQHWNGASWTNQVNTLGIFEDRRFKALACPDTTCYASAGNGLIGRYSGGNWFNDGSGTFRAMNGLDCWSATDCWAVGEVSGTRWNLDRRRSSGWSPLQVNAGALANQDLNAVSCAAATDCWAVGNRDGSRYVFGHWNGGGWTPVTLSNGSRRANLHGVHCLAANDCWATGAYRNGGNVLHYDGTGWTPVAVTVAANVDLNAVHFPPTASGGAGAVTLERWREVLAN